MRVVGVADINPKAARAAAETTGAEIVEHRGGRPVAPRNDQVVVSSNCLPLMEKNPLCADVMLEATDSIEWATKCGGVADFGLNGTAGD